MPGVAVPPRLQRPADAQLGHVKAYVCTWLSRVYDALITPSNNMHVILLYDKQDDMTMAISAYINEGLMRGQYAFMPLLV